jgi:SAM-dependent methyltransferase
MTLTLEPVEAYDSLAFAYDTLTADYGHDAWVPALEGLALSHGLTGRKLLDVACGTGKSFLPLLRRGYDVTACDASAEMLALARAKAPTACLAEADMRSLPALGRFDLVTCLDDALNYLLSGAELVAALRGIEANLDDDGLAVWDLNTLAMYRGAFAGDALTQAGGLFLAWEGQTPPDLAPGGLARATVHVFSSDGGAGWRRTASRHQQRHWPAREVEDAASAAGLELLDVRGQRRGVIEAACDELLHTKRVYVARRARAAAKGGGRMAIGRP